MKTISEIPLSDRPREKLLQNGASYLSDEELLAILLGSGTKECDVMALSSKLLKLLDSKNGDIQIDELTKIGGIGTAKAALLSASLEFTRRRIHPEGTRIKTPADVFQILSYLGTRKQEHFICISLNGAHEVITSRIVTVGLVNASQIHPREVFADAITDRACSVIVAHNHPSGELTPSKEEIDVTRKLKDASVILGIQLLDHIVFSAKGYVSLKEKGTI